MNLETVGRTASTFATVGVAALGGGKTSNIDQAALPSSSTQNPQVEQVGEQRPLRASTYPFTETEILSSQITDLSFEVTDLFYQGNANTRVEVKGRKIILDQLNQKGLEILIETVLEQYRNRIVMPEGEAPYPNVIKINLNYEVYSEDRITVENQLDVLTININLYNLIAQFGTVFSSDPDARIVISGDETEVNILNLINFAIIEGLLMGGFERFGYNDNASLRDVIQIVEDENGNLTERQVEIDLLQFSPEEYMDFYLSQIADIEISIARVLDEGGGEIGNNEDILNKAYEVYKNIRVGNRQNIIYTKNAFTYLSQLAIFSSFKQVEEGDEGRFPLISLFAVSGAILISYGAYNYYRRLSKREGKVEPNSYTPTAEEENQVSFLSERIEQLMNQHGLDSLDTMLEILRLRKRDGVQLKAANKLKTLLPEGVPVDFITPAELNHEHGLGFKIANFFLNKKQIINQTDNIEQKSKLIKEYNEMREQALGVIKEYGRSNLEYPAEEILEFYQGWEQAIPAMEAAVQEIIAAKVTITLPTGSTVYKDLTKAELKNIARSNDLPRTILSDAIKALQNNQQPSDNDRFRFPEDPEISKYNVLPQDLIIDHNSTIVVVRATRDESGGIIGFEVIYHGQEQ